MKETLELPPALRPNPVRPGYGWARPVRLPSGEIGWVSV